MSVAFDFVIIFICLVGIVHLTPEVISYWMKRFREFQNERRHIRELRKAKP